MPRAPRRHGTRSCYVGGYMRDECVKAAREYEHAYWLERKKYMRRDSWIDPTGTRRRIQALAAIGHTSEEISKESGIANSQVMKIARGYSRADGPKILQSTADRIRAAYQRLSMSLGSSPIARARAIAKGWAPPLAWDDDAIDDPNAEPMGMRPKDQPEQGSDFDEWVTLVRFGEDPERAAERCGTTLIAIERRAWRCGRKDLAAIAARARKRWAA